MAKNNWYVVVISNNDTFSSLSLIIQADNKIEAGVLAMEQSSWTGIETCINEIIGPFKGGKRAKRTKQSKLSEIWGIAYASLLYTKGDGEAC